MDTTTNATSNIAAQDTGVSSAAPTIERPEIADSAPATTPQSATQNSKPEITASDAQQTPPAQPEPPDDSALIDEIFGKLDLSQTPQGRAMQSAADRRFAAIERENAQLRQMLQQFTQQNEAAEMAALQDDPEALYRFETEKLRRQLARYERQEQERQAQQEREQAAQAQRNQLIAQSSAMIKAAGLNGDHPLVKRFFQKYPTPSTEAVNSLAAGLISYQAKKIGTSVTAAKDVARDARIKALNDAGVSKVGGAGGSGGESAVDAIKTQMRQALMKGDQARYVALKSQLPS